MIAPYNNILSRICTNTSLVERLLHVICTTNIAAPKQSYQLGGCRLGWCQIMAETPRQQPFYEKSSTYKPSGPSGWLALVCNFSTILSPPDEMLVNGKVTLKIKLESTHFYTWMERGTHLYNEGSGTGVLGYTDGSQDSPSDNQ